MTVPTHLVLGDRILEAVSPIVCLEIDRRWFLYGNIYPDISHYLFSAPHFADQSMGFVQHRIQTLCEYQISGEWLDPIFSLQLGILCHYVCDFFCHVHSSAYIGTLLKHLLYEIRQQGVLLRHPRMVGRKAAVLLSPCMPLPNRAEDICAVLTEAHRAYMEAPHRKDSDLVLAVKVSSMVLASVLSLCAESAAPDTLVPV